MWSANARPPPRAPSLTFFACECALLMLVYLNSPPHLLVLPLLALAWATTTFIHKQTSTKQMHWPLRCTSLGPHPPS